MTAEGEKKEKEKHVFHIVTSTHDSRTSSRMIKYNVRRKRDNGTRPYAQPLWLETKDEIIITKALAGIVKEDGLKILAFNICGDHIHVLLVCRKEEMKRIMGKIKGKTSRLYHSQIGINPRVQAGHEKSVPLWSQKYYIKEIKSENQLFNTVKYIVNNRIKHNLPNSRELKEIIDGFVCSCDYSF